MRRSLISCFAIVLGLVSVGSGCNSEGLVCTTQSECSQPNKPICALALCRGCSNDQDCKDSWTQRQMEASMMSMATPLPLQVACDSASGACKECLTDEHCATARPGEPLKRKCDTSTNTCVGCLDATDCASNATAKAAGLATCDAALKSCIECTSNTDCAGRQLLPYCTSDKLCGGCLTNAECTTAGKSQCVTLMVAGVPRKQCAECSTDAQCSDGKPACDAATGACTTCTGKPASFCETRNPLRPVCDVSGACSPCSKHEDCASGVCHRPGDYAPPAAAGSLMPGQCVPAAQVQLVTPANIATELTTGTAPYLSLQEGTYPDLTIAREVALVAKRGLKQDEPSTTSKTVISSISVTGGRAILYDLRIDRPMSASAKTLVKCSGGRVQMRFARLINRSLEYGIDASTGCSEVRLAQSYLETDWQALVLTAPSLTYSVTNSMIARSGSPGGPPFHANAVEIGPSATGTFAHNSLYLNRQGIACSNSQVVANSVITGTGTSVVGCTEQSVHKSTSAMAAADYVENPTGVLRPSATFKTNLIGRAMQALNPAITVDYFGGARPRGAALSADIGCEELD
jgi:hypothetical protein